MTRRPGQAARCRAVLCALGLATALAAGVSPAAAGTQTGIPAALAGSPAEFWRAFMEHFYGPYDRKLKCWIGTVEGARHCMRPHRLDTVSGDGVRHYLVVGGFPVGAGGGQENCHACAGSLGLIVLAEAGDKLELVARNSLAAEAGSWGEVPAEEEFRLREIGEGRHGWTMASGWTGQGYTLASETVFGLSGSDVVEFGQIPVHADNSGTCGDGMAACFEHDYELVFDAASGKSFYDIVLKKTVAGNDDPDSLRVPFDEAGLRYDPPDAVKAIFDQ